VYIASQAWTAFAVLAMGIALSAAAAYWTAEQVQREVRQRFERAVTDAQTTIKSQIRSYSDVVLGAKGLFIASDSVTRREFREYVDSLELSRRYPGIEAVSYAPRITAAEKTAFVAALRNDSSVDPRGYPDVAIKPAGARSEYVVVQYLEPMAGREAALGLDLAGDPVRRTALHRARDLGRITATGRITLALDPRGPAGFAMRVPIYRKGMPRDTVAQRRGAFAGIVATVFIVDDMMRGVLTEPFLQTMQLRIHDVGFADGAQSTLPAAKNLLFDSARLRPASSRLDAANAGEREEFSSVSSLEVGGRQWKLYFSANPAMVPFSGRWLPSAVLLGGAVISLLLFALMRTLARAGERALALAARITEDLRRSEAELAESQRSTQELIEALPNPIFFKDRDGRYRGVNRAWERYFGTRREAFIGKTVQDLYPDSPDVAQRLYEQDQVLWAHPGTQVYETVIGTPDGQQHDAIYYKATLTRADGSVSGLIGNIIDITKRKRAEQALAESEARYRSVIAAMAEGVIVRDRNGGIVACNSSAERILGRTLEQMRGSTYIDPGWEWFREDGAPIPDEQRPVNMVLRTGQTQSGQVVGLRKNDGSMLWLLMNAQPLFGESDSAPSAVVATITDITERKLAEQRQAMEHGVTRLLSEARATEEVMPRIIQTICEALGFACGARRLRYEGSQQMHRAETWSVASAEIEEFILAGRPPRMHPHRMASGLLRRAWSSREPVWISDVADEANFDRAARAAKAGLHAAFAFPIMSGDAILGLMEFFSREARPRDEVLLRSLRSIGAQIGQFLARRQAEELVHHLAHYDELTQLPNRSMFNQRLDHALAQARRNATSLAVLFIDLDRFKNINDALGHEAGDQVLREVAQRLQGCLREGDTVGRLGGDEFVVLIEELPAPTHVAAVAQKILAAVVKPFVVEAQEFELSASIGISAYPDDSEDAAGLLKNADIAMYRAKEQSNSYQFYSAPMNIHTLERLALESDLRRALERGEFLLHYQPKVEIDSGRITGMEALLRWQRPGQGLIAPMQFVPLAEETGLIVPIGAWVLKTACARNQAWREQGLAPLRVAVNLSARQFAHQNLLQDVAQSLAEIGLDPSALELEVTESMVMHDPERAVKLLGDLKDMGIHLSIDDFGTGYSSLSYLKRFPLDSVKIDRSFIRDIPGDADDAAITRAIIAMAHSLRLKVIAEGVETEEQLSFLREHGCDEMQGHLFSRPLPEEEFLRLLQGNVAPPVSGAG
jgi:diguanylate cyclase (GGDEF)-like protein/PAS domain S-box-containing protein